MLLNYEVLFPETKVNDQLYGLANFVLGLDHYEALVPLTSYPEVVVLFGFWYRQMIWAICR